MLVNHTYEFIFVHIPKTAGRALAHKLSQACVKDKGSRWEGTHRDRVLGGRRRIDRCHYNCTILKSDKLCDCWDKYFKFAVVRDPFARYLSAVAMMGTFEEVPYLHPSKLLPEYQKLSDFEKARLLRFTRVRPMSIQLCEPIDKIYRFENMQEMLNDLERRFGIQIDLKPKKLVFGSCGASKRKKAIVRELSDKDVEMLYDFYQKDYELYGYEFIDWREGLLVDD